MTGSAKGDSEAFGVGFPEELREVAERLGSSRPRPSPDFVTRTNGMIEADSPRHSRPNRPWAAIAGFAGAGLALLLVAAAVTFL